MDFRKTILPIFFVITCFTNCTEKEEKAFNDIKLAYYHKIEHYDPLNPNPSSGILNVFDHLVYEGLLEIGESGNLQYRNAKKISLEDKKILINLNEDSMFSDGKRVTAEDVVFTLNLYKDNSHKRDFSFLKDVKQIKMLDNSSVEIELKQKMPSFINYFVSLPVLPSHIFTGGRFNKEEFYKRPVGSGPYKISKINSDELILTRNPHYKSIKPDIEKIHYMRVEDKAQAWALLLSKENDMVLNPSTRI
jgi:peptide/nickel transport system substrate-binding protein